MRVSSVIFAAAAAALIATPGAAGAGTSVTDIDMHYKLFLGGTRVAKMDLSARIGGGRYSVSGQGATIGVIDRFADMLFTGASEGTIDGEIVHPVRHEHEIDQGGARKRHVRMEFDGKGRPKVEADPEFHYGSKRAPITEAMKAGTIDPATSFIAPVKAGLSPLDPAQCKRAAAIFDGEQRYDVTFTHKASYGAYRLKSADYVGPAIRCVVRFRPVAGYYTAGYFPFLAKRKDIDVLLAPAGEGRYLVPIRVRFPTPVGQAVFQAMRFSTSTATRAAALGDD